MITQHKMIKLNEIAMIRWGNFHSSLNLGRRFKEDRNESL